MSDQSKIEWTDATWNPVRGCVKVSPGCAHCYAETFAERFRGVPDHPYEQGFDLRLVPEKLDEPLRWTKPRRVFVNSMSDLFQDGVPDAYIDQVFAVMALAPQHTFQLLTKRPERMRAYCSTLGRHHEIDRVSLAVKAIHPDGPGFMWTMGNGGWHLPNVWLGVSVENQHFADERIPLLLQTPAAVRFISAEPLLGPLDLSRFLTVGDSDNPTRALNTHGQTGTCLEHGSQLSSGKGHAGISPQASGQRDQAAERPAVRTLDWVIDGGESGAGARPSHPDWFRRLRDQCVAAGVAYFHKQNGEWEPGSDDLRYVSRVVLRDGRALSETQYRAAFSQTPGELNPSIVTRVGKKAAGRLLDGREWNEYPSAGREAR